MAVKIRLKRMGTIRKPFYRVVVQESRTSRGGAYMESLGHYNPISTPPVEKVNIERALHWLKNGAKPTDSALKILRHCGVMKEFLKKKEK